MEKRKIGFGLVETGCRYFKPVRYHEIIWITACIEDLTDKIVQLNHRITLASDGILMLEGFEKRIWSRKSENRERYLTRNDLWLSKY